MISIKKDFNNPPELLLKSKRNDYIKDALITKNEHNFNGSIYRDKTKIALKTLYKYKCAYCETDFNLKYSFVGKLLEPNKGS